MIGFGSFPIKGHQGGLDVWDVLSCNSGRQRLENVVKFVSFECFAFGTYSGRPLCKLQCCRVLRWPDSQLYSVFILNPERI